MKRQKANVPISSDVDLLALVYCPTSLRKFILTVDGINTVSMFLILEWQKKCRCCTRVAIVEYLTAYNDAEWLSILKNSVYSLVERHTWSYRDEKPPWIQCKIKKHDQWWTHCYKNEWVCAYLIYMNVKINESKVIVADKSFLLRDLEFMKHRSPNHSP